MSTPANEIVGTWSGTAKTGLSRIIVDLKLQGENLAGASALTRSRERTKPEQMEVAMNRSEVRRPYSLFRVEETEGAAMLMKLRGDKEALFGPVLDPGKFDLSDPDTIRGIEAHQVILLKS